MRRSKVIKNLKRIRGALASMQHASINVEETCDLARIWEDVVTLLDKLQSENDGEPHRAS